ncbi:Na+/H+ antiporter NhaC family protein [Corynebacterium mendelii]|uniref:Na+/H+ antiporter NhaC-like C-terminal domain-containing protein n=1 Tax=Corynebacterium mendelii TaxID=2765362 RepID=A0A939DZ84_9CORY|nr:Na+/H+ antiporter NhaC family protein [Corynebacterium mendelii]MBN9643974.1 hypothetical protein [Corynebacterium mendelii]
MPATTTPVDHPATATHFNRKDTDPDFAFALTSFAAVVATIAIGLVVLGLPLLAVMMVALAETVVAAAIHGLKNGTAVGLIARQIVTAAWRSVWSAKQALVIFVLIGAMIAALIAAGTVATLINLGVSLVSPAWFLPAGLILCSMMSVATGTAWGTVGTAGVVLMGVGAAMGLPLPLVAGVIVSGACFGDKMSPVSDTTNLAAMSSRTDVYRHIRSMMSTTIPTYIIVLAAFTVVGYLIAPPALPAGQLDGISTALAGVYDMGWLAVVPIIVLIVLSALRVPAIPTMLLSTVVAVIVAVTVQGAQPAGVLHALWHGGGAATGIESLDGLLSRGGVVSMWFTMKLSLVALSLGGILLHFGFMRSLIAGILARVRRRGSLISSSIAAALVGNLGMGEAYLSIILGGQLFSDAYTKAGIDRSVLSRSLEEGATLTTPLIPWTTAGIFFATTLGIPTVDYLPFAWLNLLNPLVGVLFAYLGWGLMRHSRVGMKATARLTDEEI